MKIRVEFKEKLITQDVLGALEELLDNAGKTIGAIAVYVGVVKGLKPGEGKVEKLVVQPAENAKEKLEDIVRKEASERKVHAVVVLHAVGELKPKEPIMIVAVASERRREAFDTARAIVDGIKESKVLRKENLAK